MTYTRFWRFWSHSRIFWRFWSHSQIFWRFWSHLVLSNILFVCFDFIAGRRWYPRESVWIFLYSSTHYSTFFIKEKRLCQVLMVGESFLIDEIFHEMLRCRPQWIHRNYFVSEIVRISRYIWHKIALFCAVIVHDFLYNYLWNMLYFVDNRSNTIHIEYKRSFLVFEIWKCISQHQHWICWNCNFIPRCCFWEDENIHSYNQTVVFLEEIIFGTSIVFIILLNTFIMEIFPPTKRHLWSSIIWKQQQQREMVAIRCTWGFISIKKQ